MVTETKNKNWFARHWIISIFLGLIVLGIIGGLFGEDDSISSSVETSNEDNVIRLANNEKTTTTNFKQYTDEDLYTLIALFVSTNSLYTDLQKEEEFKQYDGKWIKTSGIVNEIDEIILSDNLVVSLMNPDNQFLNGATVYFDESERDVLLTISKYGEINFEGRIEDYGSFLGIIIKDAKLIS